MRKLSKKAQRNVRSVKAVKSRGGFNKPLYYFGVTLFTLFVLAVAAKFVMEYTRTAAYSKLTFSLKPNKTQLSPGEKVMVPVYLNGENLDQVTAMDLTFNYDKSKLRLEKATAGTFYEKYLTVKWDDKAAWYAIAMSPETAVSAPEGNDPVMTLEFTAIAKTDSTTISTGTTTVYVAKTGGFHPKTGQTTISVK